MELFYWFLEYFKVGIVYLILMFVWPSVIFHRFLKGRSASYKFMFCPVISIVILNTSVLLLGQFGVLRPWVFRVLFFGSILVSLYIRIPDKKERLTEAGRILAGSYGVKQLFLNLFRNSIDAWNNNKKAFREKAEGHKIEYILLSVVMLFGMIYFSYGSFLNHSYGTGDMYTHSSMLYGLINGQIFSLGVYPEGMHCFLYAMHILFGVRLFSCMLFTQCVNVAVILICAYLFFRELFRTGFAPIFALAIFLTIDALSVDEIYSMARMQWTIPQEFSLFSAFVCATGFIRYLRSGGEESRIRNLIDRRGGNIKKLKKLLYNDELILFAGALAVSVCTHFYVSGFAFFMCLCIVPFYFIRVFRPARFIPIIASVLVALILSGAPMLIAYLTGTAVQGSLGWGIDVIRGEDGTYLGDPNVNAEQRITDLGTSYIGAGEDPLPDGPVNAKLDLREGRSTLVRAAGQENEPGKAENNASVISGIRNAVVGVYRHGYMAIYGHARAKLICIITLAVLALYVILKAGNIIYVKKYNFEDIGMDLFDGYAILAISSIVFVLLYSSSYIGLHNLFAPSRLCLIAQILICAVMVIPFDVLFFAMDKKFPVLVNEISACVVTLVIYIVTIATGSLHGYLYTEFTRYNQAVSVSESIISDMKKGNFTIVSPVEEIYHVIEYGYHEELVYFINECVEKDYTLPTEYVFLFFEKHPLKYAQFNFFSGPGWLAKEKYSEYYDNSIRSVYPYHIASTASPEIATGVFYKFPIVSDAYSEWITRTVLESRLLKWVNDFQNLYPTELHVYYEDEDFVCYYFRQNPSCLYQLGFEVDDSRTTTQDIIYHTR
ncbi:MAG: hypothetical protein ILP17_07085 [Lachnospiraceae bacterium]|nr:hypothetical protein [Lachnospiraceae bacterium]